MKRKNFDGLVTFKTGELPPAGTASFNPAATRGNESTLTVSADRTARSETITIEITARVPEVVEVEPASVKLTIELPAVINLSVRPPSQEISAGAATSYIVSAGSLRLR